MKESLTVDSRSVEQLVGQIADEFTERLNRGERPGIEEYAERYPEIASVLRQALPALQWMRLSAAGGDPGVVDDRVNGCLGDFRILREVGRGGMGVVYEAEQISLNRRVALKVLPFAATLDAHRLQRFHNEARAAANLHHQHIVPVYAVGCERGVHYYAMQFIEGQSLAQVINGLRRGPEHNGVQADANTASLAAFSTQRSADEAAFFRAVARLGIQAAEALEHAHQIGIVHRDIKPENLLVDTSGNLWITDFGLAQAQSDTRLTLTGDVLGTLRYMSPEQALARHGIVDHRTDIYGLGATLYEMLTLQPATPGEDRQEILRRLALEEPTPPRKLNPAIPADLELIVLKALEKEPASRYASAEELAGDLRRFLDDQPIRARRPTLAARARKWLRRHRALAVAAVVCLVLALVALAVSTALIIREQRQTAAALDDAEDQWRVAEANFQKAREVVDRLVTRAAEELSDRPQLETLRRELLEEALVYYQAFLRERGNDPRVRLETARAYKRVGDIYRLFARHEQAEDAYRQSVALYERLTAEFPEDTPYRHAKAGGYLALGLQCIETGRYQEGEEPIRHALALCEALTAEFPRVSEYRFTLALIRMNQGVLLTRSGRSRWRESEEAFRQALVLLHELTAETPGVARYRQVLADTYLNLGVLLANARRDGEAEEAYRKALPIYKKLMADFPLVARYRQGVALDEYNLGCLLLAMRRVNEGKEAFSRSLELRQELVKNYPTVPGYRQELAVSARQVGRDLAAAGRLDEAEAAYRQAIGVLRGLVARLSKDRDNRWELALWHRRAGERLQAAHRFTEAEQAYHESITHFERLADDFPADAPKYRREVAIVLQWMGRAQQAAGRAGPAEESCRHALRILQDLVTELPNDPANHWELALCFKRVGQLLRDSDQQKKRQAYEQFLAVLQGAPNDYPSPEQYQRELASAHNAAAWMLARNRKPEDGDAVRALALAQEAVELAPHVATHWNTLGVAYYRTGDWQAAVAALEKSMALGKGGDSFDWFFLAMAHWQLGDKEQARKWYDRAVEWMEKNRPQDGELRVFRAEAEEFFNQESGIRS